MAAIPHGRPWVLGLASLGALLLGPLLLLHSPLRPLAMLWMVLLLVALWYFLTGAALGALLGASTPALAFLERWLRSWVARFAGDREALWLHWASRAHHPALGRRYLDRALALGGREAQFQEALVFLEGGYGPGGQTAAVQLLRRSAQRGHAEAAFRLAEALRTGLGEVVADPAEALVWYSRSAGLGFGPSAGWLARAYADGDGVEPDPARAQDWQARAERLHPWPALSRNLLRHDAAAPDPLVQLNAKVLGGMERAADRVLVHRAGRWGLFLVLALLLGKGLYAVGVVFWAGSTGLHHLPLLILLPPVAMLVWLALQLRRDRPSSGRDHLREAAEAGDLEACYRLGLAYRQGDSQRLRDHLSAALWFRRAAEGGHREAMRALAEAYLGGHGVLRDRREAARWEETAGRE